MSSITSRAWHNGGQLVEDFPLADLDVWLAKPDTLTWLDLCQPDPALLDELAGELGLDPLAVEDALAPRERPKTTRHETHIFFTVYATKLLAEDGATWKLQTARVSAFVLKNALITVRDSHAMNMGEVMNRWQSDGLLKYGVGGLVHGLLDVVVDGHFSTIEAMDDRLEELEDLLFDASNHGKGVQQRVFGMRKALVELRRVVLPMREVVSTLMRIKQDTNGNAALLEGYFNDLYDHVIRAAEWTESLRDLVTSVFETNLSLQDSRLNTIMKKLAGWGAIIAVPTAVTGWFGQNIPYPGFQDVFGLWQSAGLIALGTVGLYFVLRRFDWI